MKFEVERLKAMVCGEELSGEDKIRALTELRVIMDYRDGVVDGVIDVDGVKDELLLFRQWQEDNCLVVHSKIYDGEVMVNRYISDRDAG